jgi:hypothetical protein
MSRNHVSANLARSGGFVNLTVTLAAIVLIGVSYFSAVGQLAGVA